MFNRIRNYFYERRRTLWTAAGVAGAFYLAGKYVTERLEDMREQAMQMQKSRENLRRRFTQNQEDIMFTIMAHLRTLENAILEGMDVEGVTQELQSRSRLARTAVRAHSPNPPLSDSSLASSVEFSQPSSPIPPSHRRDGGSGESRTGPGTSTAGCSNGLSGMEESMVSTASTSQGQSWVQDFGSQIAGSSTMDQGPALAIPTPSNSHHRQESSLTSPLSNAGTGANMSDSITSESMTSASASDSRAGRSENSEQEPHPLSSKSKGELWHEVKILTFTRTLTIIYSTTLLSLLTTMQLNVIGRSKYLQSIVQLHREEKLREYQAYQSSIAALFFGGYPGEDDLERWLEEDVQDVGVITSDLERKFLTLSWWLLYVGWKDVGERVRKSVEEVFESVSLKSRLGPLELHRLIQDVRRRVEHEVTYEGTERRINFLSTIVPPTPETLALVFGEGGVPGYLTSSSSSRPTPSSQLASASASTSTSTMSTAHPPNPESDPAFAQLLMELRATAASPAFAAVLEASLDRGMDVLLDGLRKSVFHSMDQVTNEDVEIEKPRLANILPGLARWSHTALNTVPNELVDSITELKETRAFSAIIYSNYDHRLR
ncbi:uncharacterized protein FOMMEDRAFT_147078 [Fomitiporia mediterranea MF3/22]|uniref:uncharacterized protein n=1 Tax=Fomitiporia mediterranea (strain MF3/22) TaxID=694068 RepID=UPI0004409392|nr:uncharacterized protein FOMMEDRAFT_147078 [Fomitiporia mediterranea MF3/22]EJD01903.1 hypothetical protein FOMMEDRAFT_147078 [Fomitiporia mediterranea MF3/22]